MAELEHQFEEGARSPLRVGYQGTEGAFSHEACLRYLPEYKPVSFASFADVIAAVENGRVERGVLPLANNRAGETGVRQLLDAAQVQILDELVLPIRMHLLGLPGAGLEGIVTVVSHPVALRQCSEYLARLGVSTAETSNTAIAARALDRLDRAVLASSAAARAYGLTILKSDVHDRRDNATCFAVICKASRSIKEEPR